MASVWSCGYRCAKTRLFTNIVTDVQELRICNFRRIKSPVIYSRNFQTSAKPRNRFFLIGLISLGTGAVAGGIYSYYRLLEIRPIPNDSKKTTSKIIPHLPDVKISRKVCIILSYFSFDNKFS